MIAFVTGGASPLGAAKFLAREVATLRIASPAVQCLGTPEKGADLIGFLGSRQAGYITGQAISINGGMA